MNIKHIATIAILSIGLSSCNSVKKNKTSEIDNRPQRNQRSEERLTPPQMIAKMDTNNDGKLSEEEAKEPVARDFKTIDTDNDGYITKEELDKAPRGRGREPEGKQEEKSPYQQTESVGSGPNTTPLSAFEEFNSDAVKFSFDEHDVTIESNGLPNHTSPYWEPPHPLHIDQVVGDHKTPSFISERNIIVTLPLNPQIASSPSATGLGAIGIAISGVPIFNDQEGPNRAFDIPTALGLDYAGAHNGPGGYHYHLEAADVPENKTLSHDDEKLIGIMADGFLIYGRKCHSISDYPADLDVSGGHKSSTQHSNGDQFYHYHVINEYYINSYVMLFGGDLQGTPTRIQ